MKSTKLIVLVLSVVTVLALGLALTGCSFSLFTKSTTTSSSTT